MRALLIAAALGFLALSQAVSAKEAPKPQQQAAGASPSKVYTAEEGAALGKAARERDEARQRAWDKKTRSISRGICSGC